MPNHHNPQGYQPRRSSGWLGGIFKIALLATAVGAGSSYYYDEQDTKNPDQAGIPALAHTGKYAQEVYADGIQQLDKFGHFLETVETPDFPDLTNILSSDDSKTELSKVAEETYVKSYAEFKTGESLKEKYVDQVAFVDKLEDLYNKPYSERKDEISVIIDTLNTDNRLYGNSLMMFAARNDDLITALKAMDKFDYNAFTIDQTVTEAFMTGHNVLGRAVLTKSKNIKMNAHSILKHATIQGDEEALYTTMQKYGYKASTLETVVLTALSNNNLELAGAAVENAHVMRDLNAHKIITAAAPLGDFKTVMLSMEKFSFTAVTIEQSVTMSLILGNTEMAHAIIDKSPRMSDFDPHYMMKTAAEIGDGDTILMSIDKFAAQPQSLKIIKEIVQDNGGDSVLEGHIQRKIDQMKNPPKKKAPQAKKVQKPKF